MAEQNASSLVGPLSRELYSELMTAVSCVGEFREEVKKTSVHLVRKSAFLDVQAHKQYLLLTIKTDRPIKSPRISKLEQISKGRWHAEMKLSARREINGELMDWIGKAYKLSA
jgi:hypothetical protein